jgi:membrane-bound lytic murein transglycosylase A
MPETLFRALILLCFGLSVTAAAAPAAATSIHLRNARTDAISFADLAGWKDDDQKAAFDAFLKSCGAILNGTRAMRAARPFYGALFKVCERAVSAGNLDRDHARTFFEDNFKPTRVIPAGQTQGFFTGYYETEVEGSRFPSDEYSVPIYAAPAETVKKRQSKVFADLDRTKIEDGALAGKSLEICYVKSPIDAFLRRFKARRA